MKVVTEFEVGHEYHRKTEIHELYGGQRQGGISTPVAVPAIFLFTSDVGEKHGYKDEFRTDGLFWYMGEGQVGDMKMTGGNKAILTHQESEKSLHLFEYIRSAHVRYLGAAECLGFREETRPDREGNDRKVFVFQLDIDSTPSHSRVAEPKARYGKSELSKLKKKTLGQLRKAALVRSPVSATKKDKKEVAYYRSQALKLYVVGRSGGICEGCCQPAPFKTELGPYLECHHLYRLADGGPDHPRNVVAVCPNCHCRAHYSMDSIEFNSRLMKIAEKLEVNEI